LLKEEDEFEYKQLLKTSVIASNSLDSSLELRSSNKNCSLALTRYQEEQRLIEPIPNQERKNSVQEELKTLYQVIPMSNEDNYLNVK
ncbi:17167_t:CDS:2, partial [Funneliformis caledonium]